MSEFKTYNINQRKGFDDLLVEHPFMGNSQGDRSTVDDVIEGNSNPWVSYIFGDDVDRYDQVAVNKEIERRKKKNIEYLKVLRFNGEYGKKYTNTLKMIPNDLFDRPSSVIGGIKLESYRMVFLDMNKV